MTRGTRNIRAHGLRWRTVRGFESGIAHLDLGSVRRAATGPHLDVVKDNTVRTVMRMPDPDEPNGPGLYVKRFKFRKARERLKHLLVPTKPAVEWRVCRAMQAADIPTADVLAIAVRRSFLLPTEGWLVSREIAGARPLATFLASETDAGHALHATAAMTARLVRSGFYHRDYHVENILAQDEGLAGGLVYILDHHSIRLRRPGRRGLLRMLGMFMLSAEQYGITPRDDAGFLEVFAGFMRGDIPWSVEELRRRAGRERDRLHRIHMRSRTRRCLVESSLFTSGRADGFVVHRRRDFSTVDALEAVGRHRAAMTGKGSGAEVMRDGHRTQVTIVHAERVPPFTSDQPRPSEEAEPSTVCAKAFLRRTFPERIKDALRPRSRARSAWIAARGFDVRELPAARPLALLESRSKLCGRADYLLTEALPDEGDLYEYLRSHDISQNDRTKLGRAVADLLNRMAAEEVYHPDTKPTNVLVQREEDGYRLWLVDLDRIRFGRSWSRRDWVKALARLNAGVPACITLLDRLRCLRRCTGTGWTSGERLRAAREVYRLSLSRRAVWREEADRRREGT